MVDPASPVIVRRASLEDVADVLRITHTANAEYAGRWAVSATTEPEDAVVADMAQGPAFLAVVDGLAVGCVRSVMREDATAFIKRLAVLPQWRLRGIGRRLMAEVEGELMAMGVRRVSLGTVAENDAIGTFYERQGYRAVGGREVPGRNFHAQMWEKDI